MSRLAILYGGSLPEYAVLNRPKYSRWLAGTIHLTDLPSTDLSKFDGLLIPEGLHHLRLQASSDQICKFLDQGGTVLIFGDQPLSWLPGLDWEFRPVMKPESGKLLIQSPDHSFHRHIGLEDILHFHGVFHPPAGVQTLLATPDGGSVLYIDRVSTRGTLLATSVDCSRHVGTMTNRISERFLDRLLPWVVEELLTPSTAGDK
ncbi:hypothetical protein [Paenibacillus abyssi]|uniref:Glutamine amidotransferase domain-containing protein n=1 Tax=Paenibacillus abyssi TaxID=1340531 RepID=A0A917CTX2_9BACL|nr:hypothetical protein [Paenibacillus abyssi]GGF97687.1 hypothetical protein GCM10010916_13690 [Paenibacillus abyssi]